MIDFKEIRNAVPVPVAAEHYGLEHRNGMCRCIFHDDRTPSMKLYSENYYCFGCGEHGDVTALVAKLFGLSQYEAAQKLAADYSLKSNGCTPLSLRQHPDSASGVGIIHNSENKSITHYKKIPLQRELESKAYRILYGYCLLLKQWRIDYAPKNENDELHPLFVESLKNLDKYESYVDIFISGTKEERREFIENGKELAYAESKLENPSRAEKDILSA